MKSIRRVQLCVALLVSVFACDAAEISGQQSSTTKTVDRQAVISSLKQAAKESTKVAGVEHAKHLHSAVVSKFPDVRGCSAIDIDESGNLYVVEVARLLEGVDDARRRRPWIHQDMGLRTPQERLAMYKRFSDQWPMDYYTAKEDRVVKLKDADADGIYETQTIFADGFNNELDGLASGILTWEGKTYFSCIPNLWLLEDPDNDGVAEKREVVHSGFGVRVSIMGHDLNSMIWGPDGKLYGSIGDRGFHIKTPEGKTFSDNVSGCVFRMNPDGTEFELFYTVLRNPKAFGFDEYGKLFTVDNDGNLGDQCTMTYLIEGGEKGWHGGHQVLGNFQLDVKLPVKAVAPWTADRLWSAPDIMKQTAAHLPSGGNYRGGPSGMRLYPGIGLGDEYKNGFFVTNYLGAIGKCGVMFLQMEPDKGGYKVKTWKSFTKGVGASDCVFGYDGKLYIADFGGGWGGISDNGRVVAYENPDTKDAAAIRESAATMKAGFRHRDAADLRKLLDNPDQRIRLQAQFALARKGDAIKQFSNATGSDNVITRLHGVWGLGQVAAAKQPASEAAAKALLALVSDKEEKVREQAAKALGNARYQPAAHAIAGLLSDSSDHVRCLAAIALGKLDFEAATDAVYAMIRDNNNECAYLRHSGMMALLGISNPDAMLAYAKKATPAERLVIMMCLRRLEDPRIATFLQDDDPFIKVDTITAIHEKNLKLVMSALAAVLDEALAGELKDVRPTTWQRLINANYRTGGKAEIDRLIKTALSDVPPQGMRIMAAQLLKSWNPGTPIDFATGLSRPIPERSSEQVKTAVDAKKKEIAAADAVLDGHAGMLLESYGLTGYSDALLANLNNENADDSARAQALRSLIKIKAVSVMDKLDTYVYSNVEAIRFVALEGIGQQDVNKAIAIAKAVIEPDSGASPSTASLKQGMVRALGTLRKRESDDYLLRLLKNLTEGTLDPVIHLDVTETLQKRSNLRRIGIALKGYRNSLDKKDPIGQYRFALAGGDPAKGYKVFHESGTSQCRQCHLIGGTLPTAGPNLAGIGLNQSPEYLLRALVDPSGDLAPGYAPTVVTFKDGTTKTGMFVGKTESSISIKEGNDVNEYPMDQITGHTPPISSMPPLGKSITKYDLRNLVAYLTSLK